MSELEIVTLHESSAGRLFIMQSGARVVHDVTEAAAPEGFEFDAVALLDGDTGDWTADQVPTEHLAAIPVVATYDGEAGRVHVLRQECSGEPLAGVAASSSAFTMPAGLAWCPGLLRAPGVLRQARRVQFNPQAGRSGDG
jgi:hypothetical protein